MSFTESQKAAAAAEIAAQGHAPDAVQALHRAAAQVGLYVHGPKQCDEFLALLGRRGYVLVGPGGDPALRAIPEPHQSAPCGDCEGAGCGTCVGSGRQDDGPTSRAHGDPQTAVNGAKPGHKGGPDA